MNNLLKNGQDKTIVKKVLASCIAATLTGGVVFSSVTQASDIELYQAAKSGDITLMFLLDLSGSMETIDSGQTASRIALVRTAMIDVLAGNAAKNITKISDDKIIGLSTFEGSVGTVRIPARRLDTVISGTTTQRNLLITTINGLATNRGRTPTANAYADVASYLMGTTTKGLTSSGFSSAPTTVRNTNTYLKPSSLTQTDDIKKCSGQGIYVLTDGEPNQSSVSIAGDLMRSALSNNSFNCSNSLLPEVNNPEYGQKGAWSCIGKLSQELLDADRNPAKLTIKTAVVGFGSTFNGLTSYSKSLTQEENITNINTANINSTIANDIRNAARWGVYGGGGWYAGQNSQDVVDSVNEFINSLATEIPAVTTGSPTVPVDALNPYQLQSIAYYPQFDPTPDKTYQLWAGNLKKYKIANLGYLVGRDGAKIMDNQGKIIDNYDLWSPTVDSTVPVNADANTIGSKARALKGGAWSQLLLKVNQLVNLDNRKLLTNRVATVSGGTTFVSSTTLRTVSSKDILDLTYKNDPYRGYLISLLGYSVDATKPTTITSAILSAATELRQIGAVMHSSPILITNKGKLVSSNNQVVSTGREDYVLFGTTQGLLHVVDAETGKEKFAFVPNEMVENQKEAFLKNDMTSGGLANMFYGVDGPWTTYTEYVVDSSGALTVGVGKNAKEGKQIAYGGLRMGGRSYYALDLQNINSPKLKFQIDPAKKNVYSSDKGTKTYDALQYMGQSWSKPRIAWVNWQGTKKMVMFVGGGYDTGYESDNYNPTTPATGAGVFMFDALTGELLWWTGGQATDSTGSTGVISKKATDMKYSVVSEIRTVDSNADGLTDNIYFGDLGGQLWRVDFDNNESANLSKFSRTPVKLMSFNKGAASPRFYDMPAFSLYEYAGNKFAVISLGSGNRSKPLAEYTYGATSYDYDAVYNVYDKDIARADLLTTSSYLTQNISTLAEITKTNITSTTTNIAPYTSNGWYFKFKSNLVQSAKVMSTPIVMNYKMYVSYFDASKPGLSGDCGAGVKGESFITKFCMPFGQDTDTCKSSVDTSNSLGAGIKNPTVGCTGDKCEGPGGGGSGGGPGGPPGGGPSGGQQDQYCAGDFELSLLTGSGGLNGEPARICLTPFKWYQKVK